MCSPTQETHIPSDLFHWKNTYSTGKHISLVKCVPYAETHIPSDMSSPTQETRIPSPCDICPPTHETRITSGVFPG